jgi:hypothetical protein
MGRREILHAILLLVEIGGHLTHEFVTYVYETQERIFVHTKSAFNECGSGSFLIVQKNVCCYLGQLLWHRMMFRLTGPCQLKSRTDWIQDHRAESQDGGLRSDRACSPNRPRTVITTTTWTEVLAI